jgi:hypothetical protein
MANMPDCCKKAQSGSNTRGVSIARLCCNLNCSEPGSSGSSSSSISPQQGMSSNGGLVLKAASYFYSGAPGCTSQSPHAHDSNPKYIQYFALLI